MPQREIAENFRELCVVISPEEAVQAKDLAKLLAALAKDYAASSGGRSLAVKDISRGSIVLNLIDAWNNFGKPTLEAIEGINAIKEFADTLKKGMEYFRTSKGAEDTGPNADESLLEMFKLATKSSASIEVWQRAPDGTETILKVAPKEAKQLKKKPKRKQKSKSKELMTRTRFDLLGGLRIEQMPPEKLAEAMIAIADLEGSDYGMTVTQVIELVRSHFSNQPAIVSDIARILRERGRAKLAAQLLDAPPPHQILQHRE